jgi:hypothetical protein
VAIEFETLAFMARPLLFQGVPMQAVPPFRIPIAILRVDKRLELG